RTENSGSLPPAPAAGVSGPSVRARVAPPQPVPPPAAGGSSRRRSRSGAPRQATLIQRRFVVASDPGSPASGASPDSWYEVWNPGWARVSESAMQDARPRGIPYRRVVSAPLAGIPARDSSMTAGAGSAPAAARLASSRAAVPPGLSAFDIDFSAQPRG